MTIEPGTRFGRWTVGEHLGKGRYVCRCDCGTLKPVLGGSLVAGRTTHCRDCSKAKPDAVRRHPLYQTWNSMMNRCHNPENKDFPDWGAHGVTVCERWHTFENFVADMSPRPKGLTVERRNYNGPYSPENCYWATWSQQARNRRNNRYITAKGETRLVVEWAEITGMSIQTIRQRIDKHGWSEQDAVTIPSRVGGRTPRRPTR